MAVMDEFREEREAMKNGTPKERLNYFWCYYKWHTIIVVAVIAFIVSFAYEIVTRKENALYVACLNTIPLAEDSGEAFTNDYLAASGIDTNEYEILVDTSMVLTPGSMDENTYNTVQKMSVYVAAGEIDVMVTDQQAFEYYAYVDFLLDLRTILTEEQLKVYEPYLYYIDRKVLEDKAEASDNLEEYTLAYPDPTNPAEMEDPIPVGIYLEKATEEFNNNYIFRSSPAIIGFVVNGSHPENAITFLEYILDVE